jgi:ribosomal protein L32
MHGFAEDPIEWTLSEDERATNEAHASRRTSTASTLTTCPECHAVRFAGKPCGACGWRPQEKAKPVAVADGELARVERDRSVRHNTYAVEEKTRFHRQLLWIAREKDYKPGWAAMKYKEKFGHWPAVKPWEHVEAEPPDAAVRSWVRSRQIAYARAMQARQSA